MIYDISMIIISIWSTMTIKLDWDDNDGMIIIIIPIVLTIIIPLHIYYWNISWISWIFNQSFHHYYPLFAHDHPMTLLYGFRCPRAAGVS